jgi:hypothetical protein
MGLASLRLTFAPFSGIKIKAEVAVNFPLLGRFRHVAI